MIKCFISYQWWLAMSVAFRQMSTLEFVKDDERPILIVPIGNKYKRLPVSIIFGEILIMNACWSSVVNVSASPFFLRSLVSVRFTSSISVIRSSHFVCARSSSFSVDCNCCRKISIPLSSTDVSMMIFRGSNGSHLTTRPARGFDRVRFVDVFDIPAL